jgi:hypothetical protein
MAKRYAIVGKSSARDVYFSYRIERTSAKLPKRHETEAINHRQRGRDENRIFHEHLDPEVQAQRHGKIGKIPVAILGKYGIYEYPKVRTGEKYIFPTQVKPSSEKHQ